MKTVLIVVGKTTDKHFEAGITAYVKRICHYMPFEIAVVPELKATAHLTENEQKEREAELLRKALMPGDCIVLLDEHGTERRSIELPNGCRRRWQPVRVAWYSSSAVPTALLHPSISWLPRR